MRQGRVWLTTLPLQVPHLAQQDQVVKVPHLGGSDPNDSTGQAIQICGTVVVVEVCMYV
jgi:hypothetical protein